MRQDEHSPEQTEFDRTRTDPTHLGGSVVGMSFSGNERNNLFLSLRGQRFENVSGISGVDDPADGRALALLDYDRDGWQDFAIINANAPMLQLFRNGIGDRPVGAKRGMLAFRFVGGNRSAAPAQGLAPRDGYGAVVEVGLPDATLVREHRAGEGFAAQNSRTLLVGIGEAEGAPVRVRWPGGREQSLDYAAAGSLVTVYEDPAASPDGSGFSLAPYRIEGLAARAAKAAHEERVPRELKLAATNGSGSGLRLLTTMATWCATCRGELPQVARLREAFGEDQLALYGVPVDEDDTREMLEAYVREHAPAYQMLLSLSDEEVASVKEVVLGELHVDALPAAIVTDAQGHVLRTLPEVPSISQVRELLERTGA